MKKIFCLTLIAAILSTIVFYLPPAMSAKEDTAQLTFKKRLFTIRRTLTIPFRKMTSCQPLFVKYPAFKNKTSPNITG